jgi:hypothetical protein
MPGLARAVRTLGASAALSSAAGCGDGGNAPTPDPFAENVDIGVCDPARGPFTPDVTNPYFPLAVGSQSLLEGDEDGTTLRVEITVLDETETVAGVATRVLEERETEDGELVEVSRNFFAQAPDGTVCYFGEDVDIYEEGAVVAHDGEWRAGVNGGIPGIIMPASPAVGMAFRQEVSAGVAEDRAEITAVGETVTVPAGTFTETVRFFETSPIDEGATSDKVFARGVGLILDDEVRLVSRTP